MKNDLLCNESKDSSMRYPLVVHSNDLIVKTANDFGFVQCKLFFYILSQIPREAESIPLITVSLDSLIQLLSLDRESNYRWNIKRLLDDLATRLIYVYDSESNLYRMTWFDYIRQDAEGENYEFQLRRALEPFLLRLNRDFTAYQFAYLLEFKSSYAVKLYDFFQSIKYRRKVTLSLDELRQVVSLKRFDDMGNIVDNKYPKYEDISKKVLKPGIREINNKSDIEVSFKPVKCQDDRRKTWGVTFLISQKENPPVYDYVIPKSKQSYTGQKNIDEQLGTFFFSPDSGCTSRDIM